MAKAKVFFYLSCAKILLVDSACPPQAERLAASQEAAIFVCRFNNRRARLKTAFRFAD